MIINGREYLFQFASDIVRNGLGLECYTTDGSTSTVHLEVFRNDSKECFTYTQWTPDLPLELIEHVISTARKDLGEFQV